MNLMPNKGKRKEEDEDEWYEDENYDDEDDWDDDDDWDDNDGDYDFVDD